MLTTNACSTAAGVTRTQTGGAAPAVTAPVYLALATIPSTPARAWSDFGRKAMTNVDFHDRWPLHSTS